MNVPVQIRALSRPGSAPALDAQELYEEHADFVYLVLSRLLGPGGPEPADLLHETFIVAIRKLAKERVESPRAWLCDIAVKLAAAARRRTRVRRLLRLQVPQSTETLRTPEQIFEEQEEAQAIYAALDRLPSIKRTVFILFEIQGLTGDEIAEALRIPKKTVYTRLFHARREFARHYSAAQRRCASRELAHD